MISNLLANWNWKTIDSNENYVEAWRSRADQTWIVRSVVTSRLYSPSCCFRFLNLEDKQYCSFIAFSTHVSNWLAVNCWQRLPKCWIVLYINILLSFAGLRRVSLRPCGPKFVSPPLPSQKGCAIHRGVSLLLFFQQPAEGCFVSLASPWTTVNTHVYV